MKTDASNNESTTTTMPGTEIVLTPKQDKARKAMVAKAANKQAEKMAKEAAEKEANDKNASDKAISDAIEKDKLASANSLSATLLSKEEMKTLAVSRLANILSAESLNRVADLFEGLNANAARIGAFVRTHGTPITGTMFNDKLAEKTTVELYGKDGEFKGQSANEKKGMAVIRYAGFAVSPQAWNDAPLSVKKAVQCVKSQLRTFELLGIKQNIVKAMDAIPASE